MSIGRSMFSASTPLEYRHSMLEDISPASSTTTLPTGSVDCLTDKKKKKKKGKFSPKFSMRPFFSSISSLHRSEPRRRDASSQTDKRTANEVGVQTHIEPTVDVPVQTGFEWEDCSRAHRSSFFPFPFRRPRGPFFARRAEIEPRHSEIEPVVNPLDSVPKYSSPGDSATGGPSSEVGVDKTSRIAPEATSEPVSFQASTSKESKSDSVAYPGISDEQSGPRVSAVLDNKSKLGSTLISNKNSSEPDSDINTECGTGDEKSGPQVSAKLIPFSDKPSALKVERTDSPVRHSAKIKTVHFNLSDSDNASNETAQKEVEPALLNGNINLDKDFEDLLRNLDILVDDPAIDSFEIPKKVEDKKISFDLCQSSPLKQTLLSTRLLSAFDVLHQEVLPPILETYENCEVEPPSNEAHTTEKPPIGTLPNETNTTENPPDDTLPNETNTTEKPPVDTLPNETNTTEKPSVGAASNKAHLTETSILITKISPADDSRGRKFPPPTTELSSKNNFNIILNHDSAKPASVNVFISSKSVEANEGDRENVYESELSEKVIKTVSLPTLPSFFDSVPKTSQLDVYSVLPENFQSETVVKMMSRSSSRGNLRSNPTSDLDGLLKTAKNRFESCENLDQLEEEIIRSLCEPSDLAHKIIPTRPLHEAHEISAHDVTHVSRVALEKSLSGDGMRRAPDEIIEESKISAWKTYKHMATINKLDSSKETPSDNFTPTIPCNNGSTPVRRTNNLNKTFHHPEPLSIDNQMGASDGHSPSRRYSHERPAEDEASGTCDFAHCLRPSEMRNSPFLDKINFRCSPVRSVSLTSRTPEAAVISTNGHFEHCFKPTQMQNSAFLSDLTAKKLAPYSSQSPTNSEPNANRFASNSDINTSRFASNSSPLGSQLVPSSSPQVDKSTNSEYEEKPKSVETSHRSEITIVLKMGGGPTLNDEHKSVTVQPTKEGGSLGTNQPYSAPDTNRRDEVVPPSIAQHSLVPPPPPLPSFSGKPSNAAVSVEHLQNQPPVKNSLDPPPDPKSTPNKLPVMMELERCFEACRSADKLDQRDQLPGSAFGADQYSRPDSRASPGNGSDVSFEFHPPATATTYRCGSRELSRNGERDRLSSPTIVTDMTPLTGAVLLEERVSLNAGAGLRHTDRLFGLPVREVLKETTRTAHFRPAPPKYEGIGPTEDDGMPIAPRNSVKKEHMHDWYKNMYKSLHKADSSNDNQECIIGYSSEPESSKRGSSPRKKTSTLDGRTNRVVKGKDCSRPSYEARPRLIEDFELGHSSATDNDVTVGYKRFLPALNTPKTSYKYTKENHYTRNLSPAHRHQTAPEVLRGAHFGLGKTAPDKPTDPVVGPLPPLNYNGPALSPQAPPPLITSYHTEDNNGMGQQPAYETRHFIHSELQPRISPTSSQLPRPARSPDLKMVPGRALFDFKATSTKELPLLKGDSVLIWRQLDANWYEGERRGGRAGIFPVDYVEIVPPEHASSRGSARLLYDFTAHAPVELSAKKGDCVVLLRKVDANWYEARLDGRKGIVPSSYLHVTHELAEQAAEPPALRSPPSGCKGVPRSTSPRLHPILSDGKKNGALIEPVMYRALYPYSPLHSDELELREGEAVCVVERCDDGWFVGAAADSGRFGIFPGNYVRREEN